MHRGTRDNFVRIGAPIVTMLALIAVSTSAPAQTGDPTRNQRKNLRQRYNGSRETGNLADAARKLRSERPEERLKATRILIASNDPKSVEYLLAAASDSDIRVRVKAIDELGNRRATDATPLFIQQLFLRETDAVVQQRVLAALGKIRDPRSTEPICDFLSRDLDQSTRRN